MSSHGGEIFLPKSKWQRCTQKAREQESKAGKQDRGDFSIHWWRKWPFLSLLANLKIATLTSHPVWETLRGITEAKPGKIHMYQTNCFPKAFLKIFFFIEVQRSAMVLKNGWSRNQARRDDTENTHDFTFHSFKTDSSFACSIPRFQTSRSTHCEVLTGAEFAFCQV